MYLQVSVTCARAWLGPFSWVLVGCRLGKAATVSAATSEIIVPLRFASYCHNARSRPQTDKFRVNGTAAAADVVISTVAETPVLASMLTKVRNSGQPPRQDWPAKPRPVTTRN